jgi:hypothetical protein
LPLLLVVLVLVLHRGTVTVSSAGPRKLFKGMTTATSDVMARFPLLLPVRNSVASYGASAVTRTSDRGHVAEASNQGHRSGGVSIRVSKETFLPLHVHRCSVSSIKMLKTVHQRCVMRMRMSMMDVGMRLGDAIDPFQLANGFEAVIGYECQERSNPPFSHSYDVYKSCKV